MLDFQHHQPTEPRREWSDERVNVLKECWAKGLSASQTAATMGGFEHCMDGGRSAVIGKVHRLHLDPRRDGMRFRMTFEERMERRRAKDMARNEYKARQRRSNFPPTKRTIPLVVKETPAPQLFLGLTFAALEHWSCRYPRGEGAAMLFCGQQRMPGQSYCPACYGIAHQSHSGHPRRPFRMIGWDK